MSLHPDALTGGFSDAPAQSSRAFRVVLDALARPGRALTLNTARPPEGLSSAAGTLALVLFDRTTPVWLAPSHDTPAIRDWLSFHTGAPLASKETATFAVGIWSDLTPIRRFAQGTPEYPDRSATLIVDGACPQNPARLSGPGFKTPLEASLPDPAMLATNAAQFPLGVDVFLTQGDQVTGLPRATQIEVL